MSEETSDEGRIQSPIFDYRESYHGSCRHEMEDLYKLRYRDDSEVGKISKEIDTFAYIVLPTINN
jgi:hypothetical protein